jgi:hypothetical protein
VAAAAAVSRRVAARGEGETSRQAVGRAEEVEEGATWLAIGPQPELAAAARLGTDRRLGLGREAGARHGQGPWPLLRRRADP